MKSLWTLDYIIMIEVFSNCAGKRKLIKVIYENANKAIKLAPEWEELEDLLERVGSFLAI